MSRQILFRAVFVIALIVILGLACSHTPIGPDLPNADKLMHVGAFATLALLGHLGWPARALRPGLVSGLLLYGAGIEALQYFLPWRSSSLYDLLADVVGIGLCALVLRGGQRVPALGRLLGAA